MDNLEDPFSSGVSEESQISSVLSCYDCTEAVFQRVYENYSLDESVEIVEEAIVE